MFLSKMYSYFFGSICFQGPLSGDADDMARRAQCRRYGAAGPVQRTVQSDKRVHSSKSVHSDKRVHGVKRVHRDKRVHSDKRVHIHKKVHSDKPAVTNEANVEANVENKYFHKRKNFLSKTDISVFGST